MAKMKTVIARNSGNSVIVSLPVKLNVKAGEEFLTYKDETGSIHLIPKVENLFDKVSAEELQKMDFDPDDIAKTISIKAEEIDEQM